MAGITLEGRTRSVACKKIFGLGEEKGCVQGQEQGLKTGELEITWRQLRRRCGGFTRTREARIRALPLPELELEALADGGELTPRRFPTCHGVKGAFADLSGLTAGPRDCTQRPSGQDKC